MNGTSGGIWVVCGTFVQRDILPIGYDKDVQFSLGIFLMLDQDQDAGGSDFLFLYNSLVSEGHTPLQITDDVCNHLFSWLCS